MIRRKKLLWVALTLFVALVPPALAVGKASRTQDQTSNEAARVNNQAVAYAESGRYQEAIDLLKQAIKLRPDSALAHYNLACIYQTQGRFALAIEAFKQALLLNPTFSDAHHLMGVSYNKTEHYAEAIEC